MAHFFGKLQGSKGETTRVGGKESGIRAVVAGWDGGIEVELFVDDDGNDGYTVCQIPWEGRGEVKVIAKGLFKCEEQSN